LKKKSTVMLFSKTFSYALRGILYIALVQNEKQRVQLDEIADKLGAPRHFMGKVLKQLVKENLLYSTKGPYGGFYLREDTLTTPVLKVVAITDGITGFETCVLLFTKCNAQNPCPMHKKIEAIKNELKKVVGNTTLGELLSNDKKQLLESIATVHHT
jgi:Rrf2 family transcriptional regulator, iron-sulfur cluster assembly transcription factor